MPTATQTKPAQSKSSQDKPGILLEAGTNELEVLVFMLGETRFGVNVAKVREVIGQVKPIRLPLMHEAMVGMFQLRESVMPLIDLQLYFDASEPSQCEMRHVIVMEFNDTFVGFFVDGVDRIYRISWKQMQAMPSVEATHSVITSVADIEDHLVQMIDFEKIAFDVGGEDNWTAVNIEAPDSVDRKVKRVLLAEDSPTIRGAIKKSLTESGYQQLTVVNNGAEAWHEVEQSVSGGRPFDIIVTDIEMPELDGLALCKRIKENPTAAQVPVVVFSSLVSGSNLKKCKAVGVNAALTKPQLKQLVGVLDDILAGKGVEAQYLPT